MNKGKLKTYAPQARRDFREAVTARAVILGLLPGSRAMVEVKGDVAVINGQAYTRNVAILRERLLERIAREGFEQFVEEIAYTWFNRFTALRFMEVNGFLTHGLRVLSNTDESKVEPEILEKAHIVELPGLDRDRVIELKLAANKDAELYRLLLIAQCNQLNAAMPFLFERINDETELLLPDNLLHSDSLIRKLVNEIDEDDWREVEIIGWLYQFYISEKKDEVIGKVVRSEDIPAATQLFTPNWIVKYMTQNSLGRMWLQTYPNSGLRAKMEYYIEPAEQSEGVKRELAKLTPESINPEEIKILDPACGSGHILVEAYELLKEIYRERGYSSRDIPRLILEKNLYGLDIDERATQLASFALLMKARADERRILEENVPRLNIVSIPESSHLNANDLASALLTKRARKTSVTIRDERMLFPDVQAQPSLTVAIALETESEQEVMLDEVLDLLELFQKGKTLGALIEIPLEIQPTVAALDRVVAARLSSSELMERTAAKEIAPFIAAARILSGNYDCVIANPPYLSNKYFNAALKTYVRKTFRGAEKNLFSSFMLRNLSLAKSDGWLGFMTPFVWMYISSHEHLRHHLLKLGSLTTLVKPSYTAFFDSAIVAVVTFVIKKGVLDFAGEFFDLGYLGSAETQPLKLLEALRNLSSKGRYRASSVTFQKIPGTPIAYKASQRVIDAFTSGPSLHSIAIPRAGMITGSNDRFVRLWHEIVLDDFGSGFDSRQTAQASGKKWFPYLKGGGFRKWYGNYEYVVNWKDDGIELRTTKDGTGKIPAHAFNERYIFKPNVNWTGISSDNLSVRIVERGFLFDAGGSAAFPSPEQLHVIAAFLNSHVANHLLNLINPTVNFQAWNIGHLPLLKQVFTAQDELTAIVKDCEHIARLDWDSFENSWHFSEFPFFQNELKGATAKESFSNWQHRCAKNIDRMQKLETENNRIFIKAYRLQDELSPEVPKGQITLARADAAEDTRRLVSYAVGCMMGRYSLDEPGLIYAQSGGAGFDPSRYRTFAADADGIVPVTDLEWFDDDAANRFSEFVKCAWSNDTHTQNLLWIAAQLGAKSTETPIETIRRYFSAQFYRDHMQTYKKRPIYWLFSSGKQRAFECLVYLHRYNESTLSRMRNEYVTPLFGKLAGRIDYLGGSDGQGGLIGAATSTAEKNKLRKQLEALKKKQTELVAFDDELRHYADMRIKLDLDDGVKVNYGKFGNLLAEVKAITGASSE